MFPVEALQPTLGKATKIFQRLGVRFHLTGRVTSVLYGEPRMTQGIDYVVENRAWASHLDVSSKALPAYDYLLFREWMRRLHY